MLGYLLKLIDYEIDFTSFYILYLLASKESYHSFAFIIMCNLVSYILLIFFIEYLLMDIKNINQRQNEFRI